MFLPLSHTPQLFLVAALMAGASWEEKGDKGPQQATVCTAYWPDSPGDQGIAVSEGINVQWGPGLTPFTCPGLIAVSPHR